jgi:ABC-type methionine transport system ATPase subunit
MILLTPHQLQILHDKIPTGNKKQQKTPKSHQFQKTTSSLDDENPNPLTNLLSNINTEKKVTIILSTTDLHEKLPTSKDYLLKDGTLTTKTAS